MLLLKLALIMMVLMQLRVSRESHGSDSRKSYRYESRQGRATDKEGMYHA